MGLENWFHELSVAKKSCVVITGGLAVCASAYGLYRIYKHVQDTHGKDQEQGEGGEGNEGKKILLLGLDGSGKSAFLAALSQQGNVQRLREETKPTDGFNVVCVNSEGVVLNLWEVGGAEKLRSYWGNFTANTDLLVYVVDASDASKLEESKGALEQILEDGNLKDVPLILIASKQDAPNAKSPEEVVEVFDVEAGLIATRLVGVVGTEITTDGQEGEGLTHAKEMIIGLCRD